MCEHYSGVLLAAADLVQGNAGISVVTPAAFRAAAERYDHVGRTAILEEADFAHGEALREARRLAGGHQASAPRREEAGQG